MRLRLALIATPLQAPTPGRLQALPPRGLVGVALRVLCCNLQVALSVGFSLWTGIFALYAASNFWSLMAGPARGRGRGRVRGSGRVRGRPIRGWLLLAGSPSHATVLHPPADPAASAGRHLVLFAGVPGVWPIRGVWDGGPTGGLHDRVGGTPLGIGPVAGLTLTLTLAITLTPPPSPWPHPGRCQRCSWS
jgi:hypothetical protein